jgi:mRNA interferase MazF
MYVKQFDAWAKIKKEVQEEFRKINIDAGDVRWTSIGVNIGSEIDGKGDSFCRPALVVNVVGSTVAFIIPMSTKIKNDIAGYLEIEFQGERVSLCIHQSRVVSQKRIMKRIGKVTGNDLKVYKQAIKNFFELDK